jgi:peptidoglycan/LPS O-acetylase OafA/YrhL
MSLPGSTPLQSFLGGVCVAFPVHALLSFNNNTFGISGFIHGAARGRLEDAMSVLGLVLGGVVVAVIEGDKPTVGDSSAIPLILSGLLVGAGTKVRQTSSPIPRRNPCTLLTTHR